MNRYPLWKYITIAIALVLGFVYTLPNFFGESPAVQLSSAKATIKVDDKAKSRVEESLKAAKSKVARARYAGRQASASPATGLASRHASEQGALVADALGLSVRGEIRRQKKS